MTSWLPILLLCTAPIVGGDADRSLEIVLPPEGSPQPPYIDCQEELVLLLERDPAVRLSRGFVKVEGSAPERYVTHGKWTPGIEGWRPAGDAYWLHLDEWFIELEDPTGVPILSYPGMGATAKGLGPELGRVVRRELWHRALMNLEKIRGDLSIEADLELPGEEDQVVPAAAPEMRGLRVRGPLPRRDDGSPRVRVVVHNLASRPVHLAVVQVGEDRYHGFARVADGPVQPGTEVGVWMGVGCDSRWPLERGPIERFFVIATAGPLPDDAFQSPAAATDPERPPIERWVARHLDRTGEPLAVPRKVELDLAGVRVEPLGLVVEASSSAGPEGDNR